MGTNKSVQERKWVKTTEPELTGSVVFLANNGVFWNVINIVGAFVISALV